MPFSKDPFMYHPEEREIMLGAISETITINCASEKQAMHLRHKLYALRRAVVDFHAKLLLMDAAGKPAPQLNEPIISLAPQIQKVTIGWKKGSTVLTIGEGASAADTISVLQDALRSKGLPTAEDKQQAVADSFNPKQFEHLTEGAADNVEPEEDKADDIIKTMFAPKGK